MKPINWSVSLFINDNETSGMPLHGREELLARQPLVKHDFAFPCRCMQVKDLHCQVNADDRDLLKGQFFLIRSGSIWHKCQQEGLPKLSSTPLHLAT